SYDREEGGGGVHEFERVELRDTTLSRLASEMEKQELDRWIDVRLPALDEALESGTPVDSILRVFQNDVYYAAKDGPVEKQSAIDDLRFASAYIAHQLKQPESRLRHFNARYREYAVMLERASSRDEVIDAASRVRLENARLGFQCETLPEKERAKIAPPLTSKEIQFLFTETSPRHYTSEMTAAKLSYLSVGNDAKTKTDALMRGEISPGQEAAQLIDSLESRLERRHLKDSLAATKHFLQSLKTPNDQLRYKNAFDHSDLYRKLPAAERDFVYQHAVLQKEGLEARLNDLSNSARSRMGDTGREDDLIAKIAGFRQEVKDGLLDLVKRHPKMTGVDLTEGVGKIVRDSFEKSSLGAINDRADAMSWSRELGENIVQLRTQQPQQTRTNSGYDRESVGAVPSRDLVTTKDSRVR
ncbi:MAG TPA: hypothetical protein VK612_08685, partial [Pyrinomonadaceae bacterium]|nr:hypothetical protein [Pyrinomonadaceae bacterium]